MVPSEEYNHLVLWFYLSPKPDGLYTHIFILYLPLALNRSPLYSVQGYLFYNPENGAPDKAPFFIARG